MKRLKNKHLDKSGLEVAKLCAEIANDNKAEDIVLLDVRGISSFTDFFVIASGRSTRHVQGIAEKIEQEMCAKRISSTHSEGLKEGLWVLLDYDDVLVNIFYNETRKFYDLDGLWHDAKKVSLNFDQENS